MSADDNVLAAVDALAAEAIAFPGILDLAHQPDEYCEIDDLVASMKVIALAVMELAGTA